MQLTQKRLREVLHYNQRTGVFTWRVRLSICNTVGAVAGWWKEGEYRIIYIDKKRYYAHRLAWFYVYGKWPTTQLDHKNNIKGDDRFRNLREATESENKCNRGSQKNNRSGLKGAWPTQNNKWESAIQINGVYTWLGTFDTAEKAHAAWCKAAKKYHGKFARPK